MSQQATTGPALIEEVERMNTVVVKGLGAEVEQNMGMPPRQDPHTMEVNHGRNCYVCEGFGHMVHYCRNRGQRRRVAEGRRLEYGRIKGNFEYSDNLKGVENLESLD